MSDVKHDVISINQNGNKNIQPNRVVIGFPSWNPMSRNYGCNNNQTYKLCQLLGEVNKFKSSSLHKQIFIFDLHVAGLESVTNLAIMSLPFSSLEEQQDRWHNSVLPRHGWQCWQFLKSYYYWKVHISLPFNTTLRLKQLFSNQFSTQDSFLLGWFFITKISLGQDGVASSTSEER
jgi:hypothetical protein